MIYTSNYEIANFITLTSSPEKSKNLTPWTKYMYYFIYAELMRYKGSLILNLTPLVFWCQFEVQFLPSSKWYHIDVILNFKMMSC